MNSLFYQRINKSYGGLKSGAHELMRRRLVGGGTKKKSEEAHPIKSKDPDTEMRDEVKQQIIKRKKEDMEEKEETPQQMEKKQKKLLSNLPTILNIKPSNQTKVVSKVSNGDVGDPNKPKTIPNRNNFIHYLS